MTTKVTSRVLDTDAATSQQVADNSVDTNAIQDSAVTAGKLATNAVTEAKINASAVSTAKLADGAVTTDKLAATAVTVAKLATDAVETAKIKDLNVTTAKLADSAVTNIKMSTNVVNTAQLIDASVTAVKIADGVITDDKLAFTALAVGDNTIWMPARAIYPSAQNGASATVMSFASDTKPSVPVLTFSTSLKQYAEFAVFMPKSYDQGSVSLYMVWAHPSTATNFGVRWEGSKLSVGNAETVDAALGSVVAVTDTGGSTHNLYVAPPIVLTGGSPAVGDLTLFKIARDVSHGDDNLAVSAYLIGVMVIFTTDKANDD